MAEKEQAPIMNFFVICGQEFAGKFFEKTENAEKGNKVLRDLCNGLLNNRCSENADKDVKEYVEKLVAESLEKYIAKSRAGRSGMANRWHNNRRV